MKETTIDEIVVKYLPKLEDARETLQDIDSSWITDISEFNSGALTASLMETRTALINLMVRIRIASADAREKTSNE